jgi:phosphoribosylformylglycinamidine synthase
LDLNFIDFQVGGAVAVGEQPVKTLVCAAAGARMSVAEALTNLVFAPISALKVRLIFMYFQYV